MSSSLVVPVDGTAESVPTYIQPYRQVAGFIADCVIEEDHDDEAEITQHPVEFGANVTDNMVRQPATVSITMGWSLSGATNTNLDPQYLNTIYQNFLDIQANSIVFSVNTGKRIYQYMLLRSISVRTEKATENVLWMRVVCQELIFVTTTLIQLTNGAQQAIPQTTQSTSSTGSAAVQPSSQIPPWLQPVPIGP